MYIFSQNCLLTLPRHTNFFTFLIFLILTLLISFIVNTFIVFILWAMQIVKINFQNTFLQNKIRLLKTLRD